MTIEVHRARQVAALIAGVVASSPATSRAQAAPPPPPALAPPAAAQSTPEPEVPPEDKPWYERYRLRGYGQVRYNNFPTFDSNPNLTNDQGDKSIGDGGGIFIRRARFAIQGEASDYVSIYLQPDFASSVNGAQHIAILRDWYADIFLDRDKEFRFRVGQSKLPYGFENMQSSQNRLPFDRADALNSVAKDERDIGLFFYWEPAHIRARFRYLVDANLKGSGDFGVVALGVYNGAGANRFDQNDDLHVIARVTYPFEIGGQFVEMAVGAYRGLYEVSLSEIDGVEFTTTRVGDEFLDARVHATFVLYPQPFGIQAEYNVGVGPVQREDDFTVIDREGLHGGYATLSFKIDEPFGTVSIIPYTRGSLYEGGKKFETNVPRYDVLELETGVEWQILEALEITAAYTFADRTTSKFPYTREQGQLARLQVQFNF